MCTYDVCDEGLPVFCARYAYVLVYFFLGGGNVWKFIRAELGSKCFSRRSSLQAVCVILRSRVLHVSDIIRARKSSRASVSNAKYEFISFYYTVLIIVCRYYVSLNVPQTKKNEYCCVPSHTPHLYA